MTKQILDRLEGGYALLIEDGPRGKFAFVGSESKGGESKVIPLDGGEPATVTTAVGGMMHILPAPGLEGRYVAAMGMYAPFVGQNAGIYMLRAGDAATDAWQVEKLFDLPFAHRLGFTRVGGKDYFFAATVSAHKENPDDWSRPGQLFVLDFGQAMKSGSWKPELITNQILRNHGMWAGTLDGRDVLLLSGAEGVFKIVVDGSAASGFGLKKLITSEVSEMVAADVDGDGRDELVTLEPFHGNRMRVYKQGGNDEWESAWETNDLSFAHGLNVIPCGVGQVVVAGSRREGKELHAFHFPWLPGEPRRFTVDSDVGPTQIEPITGGSDGVARFVSCNQAAGEVSRYELPSKEIIG